MRSSSLQVQFWNVFSANFFVTLQSMTVLNFMSKALFYQDLCRGGGGGEHYVSTSPSGAWSDKNNPGANRVKSVRTLTYIIKNIKDFKPKLRNSIDLKKFETLRTDSFYLWWKFTLPASCKHQVSPAVWDNFKWKIFFVIHPWWPTIFRNW